MTPAQHGYSGLVAEVYDLDSLEYEDEAYYRAKIEAGGGPALEIGSGTGRLLVPYQMAGLDVEGVEPSEDMGAICRKKAEEAGVELVVHGQFMQALDLSRQYATIYIPVSSFQLLVDLDDAREALSRFYRHLLPGGQLIVSLYIPVEELKLNNEWLLTHRIKRPDGSMVLISSASRANTRKQTLRSTMRYEVYDPSGALVHTEIHPFSLRWYAEAEFSEMLAAADFGGITCTGELSDEPYTEGHRFMIFRGVRED